MLRVILLTLLLSGCQTLQGQGPTKPAGPTKRPAVIQEDFIIQEYNFKETTCFVLTEPGPVVKGISCYQKLQLN